MSGKAFGPCYIDDNGSVTVEEGARLPSTTAVDLAPGAIDEGDDDELCGETGGDFGRDYIEGALSIRIDEEC
jgi:hypothetical protein